MTPCPLCGCTAHVAAHAVLAALREGDVDAALDAGLLDVPACPTCDFACNTRIDAVRRERITALAARERFRARQARLARRQQDRDARRAASRSPTPTSDAGPAPALPPAAAAALARAKARAAGRTPR